MLELKDLFTKSLLAGICLGFSIIGAGMIQSPLVSSLVIALGFLGAMELGYPLLTERCGDARLMTTFMGYVTPDTLILKLITRRVIPGNFLGIIIVTGLGMILLPELSIDSLVEISWWKILLSSILAGLMIDLSTRAKRQGKSVVFLIATLTLIRFIGLGHILTDIPKVMAGLIYGAISWGYGIKVILLTTLGNFVGTRVRTLITKDNDKNN